MHEKRIAIEANHLSLNQVGTFVDVFTDIVKGRGPGAGNKFGKAAGVEPVDALRILAGVPSDWLTDRRQRLFETIYGYTMDGKATLRPEIWTREPNWLVNNPNAASGPLASTKIDVEFIRRFGLTDSAFESEVLHSGGIMSRTRTGNDSDGDRLRAYIALGMFGFADPGQFFCYR